MDGRYKSWLESRGYRIPSRDEQRRKLRATVDRRLAPKGQLELGTNPDTGRLCYIDPEELKLGLHIIGGPGQGKSNALKYLGGQLIEQNEETGYGLAVLDPHGDVADHLLDVCIDRKVDPSRVLYVDLKEGPFVPLLNPLRRSGDIVRVAYGLVEAITRAFGLEFMMENPLTAEAMINTAIVLMEKGYSLAETSYLVHQTPENKRISAHLFEGSSAVDYWRGIADSSKHDRRMETASAARRFDYFLRFQSLRRILGQTEAGIDVGRIMDEGGIAIFNLALHETEITLQAQRFIAALVLDQFKNATMRRRKHRSRPFHLFVDEFSNFASYDTMEALAEARGFGLRLVLAHQRMDQLMMKDQDPRLMKAALAIPNKLIFGAGLVDDQLQLARQAYGPWVDLQKRKLELFHRGFAPILRKVELHSRAVADSEADSESAGTSFDVDVEPTGSTTSTGHARNRNVIETDSEGYVTDHIEYQELSNVQYDTSDDQIFERMQQNIRRATGRSLFMHGYQEPPQPIIMPEQKDFKNIEQEDFLKRIYELQTGNYMPRGKATQAIEARKIKLLQKAPEQAEEIVASKGPLFKVRATKPKKRS